MNDHIHNTDSIDQATAYIIMNTARHLRFHLQKVMREFELSPEQWFLLFKLHEQDGRSQKDLTDSHSNDAPNITRLIDALEKQAWIKRTPDPDDRRKYRIYMTEAGRALMETALPTVIEARKHVFAGLEQQEIDVLLQTLARIEANLEKL